MEKFILENNGMYLKEVKGPSKTFPGMKALYRYTENKSEAIKMSYNEAVELKFSDNILRNCTVVFN